MTDKEVRSGEADIVQKQTEEALARSEALLNEVQELSRAGGWEHDSQTRHLTWTDEVYRIHELPPDYDPNDIANDIHFYLRDDQARIEEAFDRAVTAGESYDLELQFVTAKGNHRWVRTMGRAELNDEHPTRVVGNIIDITDHKQTETNLQEARKMAERYLNVAAEVILGLDAQGIITLLNDSGHRLLGYAPGELIGKNWFDTCLPEEARTEVHGVFAKLMDGQYADVQIYENSVITRNGNRLDLLWHNTLLRDTDGRIVGALSSAQDITERKRAEDKLRVAQLQWSQFLEVSPDPMWIKDASGRYVAASKSYFHFDPSAEGNIIGKTDAECFPPKKATVYVADDRIAIETGASEGEFTAVGDDGKLRTFLTKKVVLRAPDGSVAGTLGVSRDITERKRVEAALLQARDDWESTFDSLTDMVTIHDKNYDIIRANSSARQMLGLPLLGNLITNAKCFMCYHGTEKPPEGCPSCRSLVTEQPGSFELFEPHLNRYLEIRAIPRFDTHHQCIGLVHVVRDITERKQAEEEILRERAFFDQLIETAPEGIAITDTQGRVMRVNAEFVRMFGYGVDEAVGQDIDDLVAPPALDAEARGMTTSSSHGETKFLETVRRRKDDTLVDVSVIAAPVLIAGKQEANYAIYRDITERKQMEQKLEEMATHDFLTGLPNRALLLDRFTIAAALARRNKSRLAVISLDLDKFKSVNDTLGHDAGDQVLKTIGIRLTRIVRASDTFARVGGDEFISVMLGTSRIEDASVMAQKILDSFREPVSVGEHQLHLSTSIGIAIYPDDGDDLETLTKKSDAAMYYSKGHGGNQLKFYRDGDAY